MIRTGASALRLIALRGALVMLFAVVVAASGVAAEEPLARFASPYPGRVERQGDLKITVGELRVVYRGAMFPHMGRVAKDSLIITVAAGDEHADRGSIRSEDNGETWRPIKYGLSGQSNVVWLKSGKVFALHYDTTPIKDKPGYRACRYMLEDEGWTKEAVGHDGIVHVPPPVFDIDVPDQKFWFHGNTVQMPDGTLLAMTQTSEKGGRDLHPCRFFVMQSQDEGKTWSKPGLTKQARGCMPRMAVNDGILALSYGSLAFPRWGNAIAFSLDGGQIWTDEINYAPFFTTGYSDIVAIGPGKFLVAFDATPPQPWVDHAAHWVGVTTIEVQRINSGKEARQ